DKCEKDLGSVIAEEAKVNDYVLKNACKDLVTKKLLTGVAAKRCAKI
ncbi:MAG: hypothetical protein IT287_09850, partial [Bdellovibrionaceae bacterium]|nr:hypothetical protein [Pseudobdellovibrionaceae bacterium]